MDGVLDKTGTKAAATLMQPVVPTNTVSARFMKRLKRKYKAKMKRLKDKKWAKMRTFNQPKPYTPPVKLHINKISRDGLMTINFN